MSKYNKNRHCNHGNNPQSNTDGMIICPYCGCDAWHVGSIWFRCFLCGRTFGGKSILNYTNIRKANRDLRNIKLANEQFDRFFRDWYENKDEDDNEEDSGNENIGLPYNI
jgi:ribosomal protein L37AE/L43A